MMGIRDDGRARAVQPVHAHRRLRVHCSKRRLLRDAFEPSRLLSSSVSQQQVGGAVGHVIHFAAALRRISSDEANEFLVLP
jgi:hypothetical protein